MSAFMKYEETFGVLNHVMLRYILVFRRSGLLPSSGLTFKLKKFYFHD